MKKLPVARQASGNMEFFLERLLAAEAECAGALA
jgi:hypothetical protein